MPTDSFLWIGCTNTEDVSQPEEHTIHLTSPLSSELQTPELTSLGQLTDLGNGVFTACAKKAFILMGDICSFARSTLDSTFYSVGPGCVTIQSAAGVRAHFSGQVSVSSLSTLTFEQRHRVLTQVPSITMNTKMTCQERLGKPLTAFPLLSPLTCHNYSQQIMRAVGLARPWKDRQNLTLHCTQSRHYYCLYP